MPPPLELPNECHPPTLAFTDERAMPGVDRNAELPNERHPPTLEFSEMCAMPGVDWKAEFRYDCHPPMPLREPRAVGCEVPE